MSKVVITGSSGLLGPYVADLFIESGYEVLCIDTAKSDDAKGSFRTVDLMNLGECYGALAGADAVVHLAAIPAPYGYPNEVVYSNNVVSTYNILEAAAALGIKKAVAASSESIYGFAFSQRNLKPQYVPIDEDHRIIPDDSYALSKMAGEQIADVMHWRSGIQVVSFRIAHVIDPESYESVIGEFIHDTATRSITLWSYVDARDVASACKLAIEADGLGTVALNLTADDTSSALKNSELLKAEYPDITDFRAAMDNHAGLFSNKKAKEVLGWQPAHSWRDYISDKS